MIANLHARLPAWLLILALVTPGARAADLAGPRRPVVPEVATGADTEPSDAVTCRAEPSQLPPLQQVRAALLAHPMVLAARARSAAGGERAEAIRVGSAETQVRAVLQRRSVRDPAERYAEGQLAFERPMRWWGKADADARLADATARAGQLDVADSLHEGGRQLLAAWFDWQRAALATRSIDAAAVVVDQLTAVVGRRLAAGDAARIDRQAIDAERARFEASAALLRAAQAAARLRLNTQYPDVLTDDAVLQRVLAGAPEPAGVTAAVAAAVPAAGVAAMPVDSSGLLRRYLDGNHELRLAMAESTRLERLAQRQVLDRYPDPSIGVFGLSERAGAERIVGLSVSIPLPGQARASHARAALEDAGAARQRVDELARQVSVEFGVLHHQLVGRCRASVALAEAARQQQAFADKVQRAYALGEAGIAETLYARRLAYDARLEAGRAALDAAEGVWRLRLDLHEIWDLDDELGDDTSDPSAPPSVTPAR